MTMPQCHTTTGTKSTKIEVKERPHIVIRESKEFVNSFVLECKHIPNSNRSLDQSFSGHPRALIEWR
jgi:hypothetical protein